MKGPELKLYTPHSRYKLSYLQGLQEFRAEGLRWHLEIDPAGTEEHFEQFVEQLMRKKSLKTETIVPETELWGVLGGEYIGRISIRHELNERLKAYGGHIGYDVRPSFRGRGLATRMLALALLEARRLGLARVLLTCNDTNLSSIRVIEKNGGKLERIADIPDAPRRRYYWIDT